MSQGPQGNGFFVLANLGGQEGVRVGVSGKSFCGGGVGIGTFCANFFLEHCFHRAV